MIFSRFSRTRERRLIKIMNRSRSSDTVTNLSDSLVLFVVSKALTTVNPGAGHLGTTSSTPTGKKTITFTQ